MDDTSEFWAPVVLRSRLEVQGRTTFTAARATQSDVYGELQARPQQCTISLCQHY